MFFTPVWQVSVTLVLDQVVVIIMSEEGWTQRQAAARITCSQNGLCKFYKTSGSVIKLFLKARGKQHPFIHDDKGTNAHWTDWRTFISLIAKDACKLHQKSWSGPVRLFSCKYWRGRTLFQCK